MTPEMEKQAKRKPENNVKGYGGNATFINGADCLPRMSVSDSAEIARLKDAVVKAAKEWSEWHPLWIDPEKMDSEHKLFRAVRALREAEGD